MDDDECVQQLGRPISSMKVTELRDELMKRALIKTGNKKELIDRLRAALQKEQRPGGVADLSVHNQPPQQTGQQFGVATDLSISRDLQLGAADLSIQQAQQLQLQLQQEQQIYQEQQRQILYEQQQQQQQQQQQERILLEQQAQSQQHIYQIDSAQQPPQLLESQIQQEHHVERQVEQNAFQYSGDGEYHESTETKAKSDDTQEANNQVNPASIPVSDQNETAVSPVMMTASIQQEITKAEPSVEPQDNLNSSNQGQNLQQEYSAQKTHEQSPATKQEDAATKIDKQPTETDSSALGAEHSSPDLVKPLAPPQPKAIPLKRGISELRNSGTGRKEKRRRWGASPDSNQAGAGDVSSQNNLTTSGISSQKLQELIAQREAEREEAAKRKALAMAAKAAEKSKNETADTDSKRDSKDDNDSPKKVVAANEETLDKDGADGEAASGADVAISPARSENHQLDVLFKKTKSVPHLYWLPLNEEEAEARVKVRAEREAREKEQAEKAKQAREARVARGKEVAAKRRAAASPPPRRRSPIARRVSPSRHRSPVRRSTSRHRSPPRRSPPRRRSPAYRGGGPMGSSPPIRRRSPAPIRRSPGPIRRSPGPIRRSPGMSRRSPGPIRRSPPRRSPGPIRRSPGPIRRSPGPIRRSPGPIRRSPPLGRNRSPGPLRRSPGPIRRSPGPMRRSPGPIRRSPGPMRRSPGPIRRSPGFMRRGSPGGLRRSPVLMRGGSPQRGRSPPRRRSPIRRRSRSRSVSLNRDSDYLPDPRRMPQRSDRLR